MASSCSFANFVFYDVLIFPTLAEVTGATKSFEGPRDCDPWDALLLVHNMFEIDQNSKIWGPFPLPIIDIDKRWQAKKKLTTPKHVDMSIVSPKHVGTNFQHPSNLHRSDDSHVTFSVLRWPAICWWRPFSPWASLVVSWVLYKDTTAGIDCNGVL